MLGLACLAGLWSLGSARGRGLCLTSSAFASASASYLRCLTSDGNGKMRRGSVPPIKIDIKPHTLSLHINLAV